MKEEGYIPISRKLFEHPFWCELRVYSRFEAWFDLLQSARFEDTKQLISGRLVKVKRGQVPISLRFLANRWGWSPKKVNTFLELLILDKMITKETGKETGQTVVTICNYDRYNSNSDKRKQGRKQPGNTEETVKKQMGNSKETSGKQQGNTEETNKKKENKGNKGNNNPLPLFPELDFVSEEFREAFSLWLDYKKERKEKYKSERSLKICYNNLVKFSGNDPVIASEIINQAIASNYAGFFPLKNKFDGNKNTANVADSENIVIRTTDL